MTNHPLTDEDCYKLCNACGLDHAFDNMRRAADWQLEQVIEFASKYTWLAFRDTGEKAQFIQKLKEAMRPTQGEHLQDEAVNKFIKNNSAALTELADS